MYVTGRVSPWMRVGFQTSLCQTSRKASLAFTQALVAQEKEIIEAALRESRGRVSGPSGAAAKLGIPGSTLDSKIRSLNIDKNRFKSANS